MITRRTLDGALKCALRDFLREEWRARRVSPSAFRPNMKTAQRLWVTRTGIDLRHCSGYVDVDCSVRPFMMLNFMDRRVCAMTAAPGANLVGFEALIRLALDYHA